MYRCEVSQRCRKGSANHQQWSKEVEKSIKGNFRLVLPNINADGMQEKGGRNEAEVVKGVNAIRQNFHCP